jgi:hypothetical protein
VLVLDPIDFTLKDFLSQYYREDLRINKTSYSSNPSCGCPFSEEELINLMEIFSKMANTLD